MYIYIYIYMCVCVYMYIYICICIRKKAGKPGRALLQQMKKRIQATMLWN